MSRTIQPVTGIAAGPRSILEPEEAGRFFVPHVLSAYAAGELSFEEAAARCAGALSGVAESTRQRLLGSAVEALLGIMPNAPRRDRRPRPLWLCRACSDLVDVVVARERLPFAKQASEETVFDRVAEMLVALGVRDMTADAVTKARADWKMHLAKA